MLSSWPDLSLEKEICISNETLNKRKIKEEKGIHEKEPVVTVGESQYLSYPLIHYKQRRSNISSATDQTNFYNLITELNKFNRNNIYINFIACEPKLVCIQGLLRVKKTINCNLRTELMSA